jgi:transcription initiation factor IIF auxiliary subunit
MKEAKVLNSNAKKNESGEVVVTKTIEETLNENDILQIKQQLNQQKQNLFQQIQQVQERIDAIKAQEEELDSFLNMLKTTE